MSPEGAGAFELIGPAPPIARLEPGALPLAILVDYDVTIAPSTTSLTRSWRNTSRAIRAGGREHDRAGGTAFVPADGLGDRPDRRRPCGIFFATVSSQPHDPGFMSLGQARLIGRHPA